MTKQYRFAGIQDSDTAFPDDIRKDWGVDAEGEVVYTSRDGDLKTKSELKSLEREGNAQSSITVCGGTPTHYTVNDND